MRYFFSSFSAFSYAAAIFFHNHSVCANTLVNNPTIFLGTNGDTFSIWERTEQDLRQIRFARKTTQGNWSPSIILSDPAIDSYAPLCIINSNGDGAILWLGINQTLGLSALYGAIFSSYGEWSKPLQLSDDNDLVSTGEFDLQISEQGNISAIWKAYTLDKETYTLYSSFATQATGWSTPSAIAIP